MNPVAPVRKTARLADRLSSALSFDLVQRLRHRFTCSSSAGHCVARWIVHAARTRVANGAVAHRPPRRDLHGLVRRDRARESSPERPGRRLKHP